jgi:hypothetical protein
MIIAPDFYHPGRPPGGQTLLRPVLLYSQASRSVNNSYVLFIPYLVMLARKYAPIHTSFELGPPDSPEWERIVGSWGSMIYSPATHPVAHPTSSRDIFRQVLSSRGTCRLPPSRGQTSPWDRRAGSTVGSQAQRTARFRASHSHSHP